jgi:ATP-binding cassette subfamily B protein
MHIGSRINLTILSDFLIKLMRLPLAYFDVKLYGDLIRRINDHERIRYFLTTSSLSVVFSLFNLLVFGAVLAHYNVTIFCTFAFGSLLYAGWAVLFLGPCSGGLAFGHGGHDATPFGWAAVRAAAT